MAAGRELFKLFGVIGMHGVEGVEKNLKKIDKQARKLQREIGKTGRKFQKVGKIITKAFTIPLLAAGAASIKFVNDATDLNETISKTGEIFGETAKDIEKWADTSALKLGQSKTQAMDAASTFAIFGKSAGLAGKDLTKFSTEFVELASDMSSFFNTEPEDAITAIGAAFRGETEPIRRYGVMLDDATMRQKAFELGLITSTKKALMPQTKILAAQAVILEQTKVAQGDFARTSAGLANQKRILNAQLKNVSATLGQLFLPAALEVGKVVSRLIGLAERAIDAWKALDPQMKKTIKGFIVLAAAIGPVVFLIGKFMVWGAPLVKLFVALKMGTLGWSGAMAALGKSVMGVTLVVGALVALGWYWYSQWDTMSVQLKALWAKIVNAHVKGAAAIAIGVTNGILSVLEVVGKASAVFPGLEDKVKKATLSILKYQASLYKNRAEHQAYTNKINESAVANKTFTETLKGAIAEGKKAIGIKEETTKKTQKQIDAEKESARQAEETAKQRKAFNQDILDQTKRLGADKMGLLMLERAKAVEEAKLLGADVYAVKKLYAAKEKELLEEDEKEREEFNNKIKEQISELTDTKLQLLEYEKEVTLLKADELGADKFEVAALYAIKEQKLKEQIRKEDEAKERRAMRDRLNQVTSIGNKVNGILGKFSDNKMKRLDIEEKRQIEAIKTSEMTEENKEAAIQKIQEETEQKRRKLARQRAIQEKLAALFNIAINTASAVVEALPNIPLSIIVGGLGLASGIAVASQPLPLYEGGLVKGSDGGVNTIVGEKNQDEIVFPLERGIDLLAEGLTERVGQLEIQSTAPQENQEIAGIGSTVHLHIGTLIADERGLKELERRLDTVRIAERQRKGV